MKKLISVLLILALMFSVAHAAKLDEIVEEYNYEAEIMQLPQITTMPIDGTFFCIETGILIMFIKSETSDDIDLISCCTFGKPNCEGFLMTVCAILNMVDKSETVLNYGRMMNSFILAKRNGSVLVRTYNDHAGQITCKPDQYTFFIQLF